MPGVRVLGIAADLGGPADTQRLLASLGQIDILVNNIGLFDVKSFEEISDSNWSRYKAAIIGANHTSLLERFIDPKGLAHLTTLLAGPLSSATNGVALRVDGGVPTSTF